MKWFDKNHPQIVLGAGAFMWTIYYIFGPDDRSDHAAVMGSIWLVGLLIANAFDRASFKFIIKVPDDDR